MIKIVKPTKEHIPELVGLWREQYEFHNKLDSEYYVENSSELDSKFAEYLTESIEKNDPYILIATKEDTIVGFITYEIDSEEYFDTKITEFGSVIELFVKETERKQGIGQMLMEAAEEFFKEKGVAWIELVASQFNHNAGDFYKNKGFEIKQNTYFKKI